MFQVGRITIVKMTILPSAIHRFNVMPIKLPISFFTEQEENNSQFMWKHKRPHIAKAIPRKKEKKTGGTTRSGFKLYYKALLVEIA